MRYGGGGQAEATRSRRELGAYMNERRARKDRVFGFLATGYSYTAYVAFTGLDPNFRPLPDPVRFFSWS